jgi:hypothetical protein
MIAHIEEADIAACAPKLAGNARQRGRIASIKAADVDDFKHGSVP